MDFPAADNAEELFKDLNAYIVGAQDCVEALGNLRQSRELSLVRTRLEEAEMWLERVRVFIPAEPPEQEGA